MATRELIDLQFDRAVEIVQSLPKTGPIQTDYEEKLQMYSLYKQATVGNVKSPRPGIWDMLGRAKWDAWAKHKDLDSYEAKWSYVEALLKVLRRYSDKTIAQNLVQELESYGGDPSNLVLSRTSMQSPGSESSGSTTSHDAPLASLAPLQPSAHHPSRNVTGTTSDEEDTSTDGETGDDEAGELRPTRGALSVPLGRRPGSSHSARYQTPITGSFLSQASASGSGGIGAGVPATQPLPAFETPSAFPAPPSTSTPGSRYSPFAPPPFIDTARAADAHPYRPHSQSVPLSLHTGPIRPASRITLERTIENVQAHLAAITERLEMLESRSLHHSASSSYRGSPQRASYPESGPSGSSRLPGRGLSPPRPTLNLDDLGMWSYVLNTISYAVSFLQKVARFFASDVDRSPTKVIVRRLCLDLSFLLVMMTIIRTLWKRSGVRRREVKVALAVLWGAIVGHKPPRNLQDRGV